LLSELTKQNLVAIVKLVPRNNQELRFAALFPQEEKYDEEDHFQTPPGFNMVILPFAEDIVNFTGDKTICKPQQISTELVQITKLLINNLTIHDFDFRDFENPALQKFYSHLQAHALNEKDVVVRPDLLEPDLEGFNSFRDVIDLVRETVMLDCEGAGYSGVGTCTGSTPTPIKEEDDGEVGVRRGKAKPLAKDVKEEPMGKSRSVKEEDPTNDLVARVESLVL
jgi:ATP-dependent DNA helicase 2 subunit 1